MDDVQKQDFQIRDLGTRSVTLFPSRAQVVRDIKAQLKPGSNQITIIGLSPSVDEHSIKVEGTGSAIITDIAVEYRPNREIFQDFYPDSDDSEVESGSEKEEDDTANEEDQAMKEIQEKMTLLFDEQKRAKEVIANADNRLKILDSYGRMLTSLPPGAESSVNDLDIGESLDTYRTEREKIYKDTVEGSNKEREIADQLAKLKKEEGRLRKLAQKEKAKARKLRDKARRAKKKEEEKAARKREKATKEKARVRRERESFWPQHVYIVRVSLEATNLTPLSSRRGSVSSDQATFVTETPEHAIEDEVVAACDLTLTYVTSYAYWSPSYDLALSTTSSSATLLFDAQLVNKTSETWSNCKVILSTSQADFSGLNDKIPTLVPWRVRLDNKGIFSPGDDWHHQISYSREEQSQKAGWTAYQNARQTQKPRSQLFGVENSNPFGGFRPVPGPSAFNQSQQKGIPDNKPFAQYNKPATGGLFGSSNTNTNNAFSGFGSANVNSSSSFGMNSNTGGGLFGTSNTSMPAAQAAPQAANPFGSASSSAAQSAPQAASPFGSASSSAVEKLQVDERVKADLSPEELRYAYKDGQGAEADSAAEEQPELDFQDSSFEETGFTSTYELPGLKTLAPSSTTSKQRVARITFSSVAFSHTVVAKYKPAAYLKARLRNGSKLTLLKGHTGLTLDGTFMGRTFLPRCSPGDSFNLSLGVDPSIRVAYPKPDIKRGQSGLFSKEDSSDYTRIITLFNTRSGEKGKPIHITVLDQVPVSEDEKLRVNILQPRGLGLGGFNVTAGTPGREGKEDADWGKANATLKKGGEIAWDVELNAGRMVKLALEYELSLPLGAQAVNV